MDDNHHIPTVAELALLDALLFVLAVDRKVAAEIARRRAAEVRHFADCLDYAADRALAPIFRRPGGK